MHVTAVIPAAGAGVRMGRTVPKPFLPLGGIPLLARTLLRLARSQVIDAYILVVPPGTEEACAQSVVAAYRVPVVARIVPGGPVRQASVWAGLQALPSGTDLVLVHDAARPCVPVSVVQATVEAAARDGAAVAAIPATETVKEAGADGRVLRTLPRETLWIAQTPQAFARALLLEAHAAAAADGFVGTDDAALVERLGRPVTLVPGSAENIKVTHPADLEVAARLLAAQGEG
ncbi:MAG: 2-C-methyl-D-erythritol 4-phosphate cytidylyltransferase [candidate division NC10 bacterium]|nr:2-C-methyl-D-erythritol 4-phosphate cytidylyltransferase [candidate division NC10 bacterium]